MIHCARCPYFGQQCQAPATGLSPPGRLRRLFTGSQPPRLKNHSFQAAVESGQLRVKCLAGHSIPVVITGTADHAECYVRYGGSWILGGWQLQRRGTKNVPYSRLAECVNQQQLFTDVEQLPKKS